MSNEERLVRIKDTHNRCVKLKYDSITWLIQQAEHAQHLERRYENTGSMFGRQAQRTLIDENKRLHEALVIAYSHCDDNLMDETIDVIRMALDGDDDKEIWADELVKGYRALEDNS